MANFANQDKVTTFSASSGAAGVTDNTDKLHSGIIKVLHKMAKGNYVIEFGNFQQLQGSSASTKYGFDGGSTTVKYMLDGEYKEITSNVHTEMTVPNTTTGNDRYDLIVIRAGAIVVIAGTASSTPTIGDMGDDDVPVAMVKVVGGSTANPSSPARDIQLFTYNKDANSVSIGYNSSSSVYTNKGTFTASSAGLLVSGVTSTVFTTPFMSIGNGATNAGELRFLEDTDNGSHYTGFKAPAAVTSNAVYTLPAAFPGGDRTLQSDSSGVLSWVTGGGGTITALNNQTANRLVSIGATTTELDGEANLTFDGSELGLTGHAEITHSTASITSAGLKVDKDFTGTTSSSNRGVYVDFDATGITASGQTSDNYCYLGLLNSDAPTMVGTVNNYGANFQLTGGTSGTQKNVGIHVQVGGADTNYAATLVGGNVGIGTTAPEELLHLVSADGSKPVLLIENQNDDSQEAGITFFKNPISGHSEVADSDDIGIIRFKDLDKGGATHTYAYLMADSHDADAGTEDGRFLFYLTKAGTDGQEVFRMSSGEACFNEGGADIDFRVESDNNANALVVDAGNDRIGIGKAPLNTIDFGGNEGHSIVKLTATTNAASTFEDSRYVVFSNGSAVAATMPAGAEGRTYTFKNINAGQVTITRAGSDEFRVIDAGMGGTANTLVLDVAQYATVVYIAAESIWEVFRGTNA